jgi:CRP/FNR family nitrogen fixation transcriptional regulator
MDAMVDCATSSEFVPWRRTSGAMEDAATVLSYEGGDTIYHRGEASLYWYRIVSGAVRKCTVSADGHRQVVDFLLAENLFGFAEHGMHRFSAEALSPSTLIARYPRHNSERLVESDTQVSRWLRAQAFDSISRLEARALILGRTGALARVSAFLLDWADRSGSARSGVVSLPMSRYDIADYVCMAVETVCRALTALREHQVIAQCATRCLRICDRSALERAKEGGQPLALGHGPSRRSASRAGVRCQ